MTVDIPGSPSRAIQGRPPLIAAVLLTIAVAAAACGQVGTAAPGAPIGDGLPLTMVTTIALPGETSRLDYATIDPAGHRLFIAHLGASQIIEVDTTTNQVVQVVDNIAGVHGDLVVPNLHRVFATATTGNQVLTLDEDTGTVSAAPTGTTPTGWPTTRPPAGSG